MKKVSISLKGWTLNSFEAKANMLFLKCLSLCQTKTDCIELEIMDYENSGILDQLLTKINNEKKIKDIIRGLFFRNFPNDTPEHKYSIVASNALKKLRLLTSVNVELPASATRENIATVSKKLTPASACYTIKMTIRDLQVAEKKKVDDGVAPMSDEQSYFENSSGVYNGPIVLHHNPINLNNPAIPKTKNIENNADMKDERRPRLGGSNNSAAPSHKRRASSMQPDNERNKKSRKKPKVVKSTQAGTDYNRSPFERYIDQLMRDGHMPHGKKGIPVSDCVKVWELLIVEHIPEEVRVRRHYRGELARKLPSLPEHYHPISLSGQKDEMVPYPEKLTAWGEKIKQKIGTKDKYGVVDVNKAWESLVKDSEVSKEEPVDFPHISRATHLKLMSHMSYCNHLAQNPEKCRKILASSPKGWAELLASEYGPDAPAGMEIDSEGSSLGNSSSSSNNSNSNSSNSNSTLLNSSTLYGTPVQQPHSASSLNALQVGQRKGAS